VATIAKGRRFVIVDGVGYPAVGSIAGVSNADVARLLGAPVLMIGRPGLGDAVDAMNLNSTFFTANGGSVLGAIW
jgi:MoxR-like ATPase